MYIHHNILISATLNLCSVVMCALLDGVDQRCEGKLGEGEKLLGAVSCKFVNMLQGKVGRREPLKRKVEYFKK